MTNRTTTIELNVQTLVALTGINRTSIVSICKRGEELGLKFEKDSRDKIIYTEQDFELLKKVKKMKDKYKYTYEQALQKLFEEGELKDHMTTEAEKKRNNSGVVDTNILTETYNHTPIRDIQNVNDIRAMDIEVNKYPSIKEDLKREELDKIMSQIEQLEHFLNFVKNDVQTQLRHLYHSIDVKFTETYRELNGMKDTLAKTNSL